jgi:cellulose synthase/poly-beta-1,6-N-acetylglucosamine synthase-like glycosyltransferase
VVRRKTRKGYKAGALSLGLRKAKGEFIAIFDADFLPEKDFLLKTMVHFKDFTVGMVQTRWAFLNTKDSWLTAVQSILIGHHFDIEHRVRYEKRYFFNFNGTAGIWRKDSILSSGSWQNDTVTEDLDLSYRAQLKGWRFVYLDKVTVMSEFPSTMASFLKQQQRWAIGSTQTALKLIPAILKEKIPLSVKREALFHLLSNICWLMGFVYILTLYPAMMFRMEIGPKQVMIYDIPLFTGSCGVVLAYFFFYLAKRNRAALLHLPLVPFLSIGLTPSIALSILFKGFRKGGEFKRTPKYGHKGKSIYSGSRRMAYEQADLRTPVLNAVLTAYTAMPLWSAWNRGTWPAIPFLLLFPMGFILVLSHDLPFISRVFKQDSEYQDFP